MVFWIVFFLVALIMIIISIKSVPKCDRCKTKMKLVKSSGDATINASDTVRISFIKGVPENQKFTYRCPSCGFQKVINRKRYT